MLHLVIRDYISDFKLPSLKSKNSIEKNNEEDDNFQNTVYILRNSMGSQKDNNLMCRLSSHHKPFLFYVLT